MKGMLSRVAISNLFTKGSTVKHDFRQAVLPKPGVPDEATRLLLAQLILEEAQETINALGFLVTPVKGSDVEGGGLVPDLELINTHGGYEPDLESIIDGCCDLNYVATGAMVACGVPDLPHLYAVCRANNQKFPGGVATINPDTGKYLKPEGWRPPNHDHLFEQDMRLAERYGADMLQCQAQVVKEYSEKYAI
jgi:hypothetical protein